VADDHPVGTHALGCPLHRQAVKAVAPYLPLVSPAARDGVRGRLGGDRPVEGRVEDGQVREVRKCAPRLVDRCESRAVVKRRELREPLELLDHAVVDPRRDPEPPAAVDDAVRDRLDPRRHDSERRDLAGRAVHLDG